MLAPRRGGLSLLEVVVILFVIAILVSLVLPAVNIGRGRPRRNQCFNNMKQLGLAVQNFQTSRAGIFPVLVDDRHGWPVQLLPFLDQPGLVREIASENWSDEQAPYLSVFVCYEDMDSVERRGGLSYVANGGYGFFPIDRKSGAVTERGVHSLAQDWDGDGDVSEADRLITRATGVVWRPDEVVPLMTQNDVGAGDGAGQTLLFAENLHAGPWTSRTTKDIAFVIGRDRLTFAPQVGPLAVAKADLGPFAINGAEEPIGAVPAPSSNHSGVVQVVFADGRANALSEEIDPLVYIRLLSPQGSLYGQKGVREVDF